MSATQAQAGSAPLPCHREQRCTAAMAAVIALCQIEQMPWGPERPVKCRQDSQELNGEPKGTSQAKTHKREQDRTSAMGSLGILPLRTASNNAARWVEPPMLKPTQYGLNGSGPERPHSNCAGLGPQWRTVFSRISSPTDATETAGAGQAQSRRNSRELMSPPLPTMPERQGGRSGMQQGNSAGNKAQNDLNHDKPQQSRKGKQGRQTRSNHGGPTEVSTF